MFPRSTHETFSQKLYTTFQKNKRFLKPKLSRTAFTIVHYAGDVCCHLLPCLIIYNPPLVTAELILFVITCYLLLLFIIIDIYLFVYIFLYR